MNAHSDIRVLQLISSEGFYGAENMLVNLAQGLVACGASVIVASFRDSRDTHTELLDFAAEQGLETTAIPCEGRMDWSVVRRIRSILAARNIDVVHSHGYKSDLYGYFASRGLPVALVATCHNWPGGARILQYYAKLDRLFLRAFDRVSTPSPLVAKLLHRAGVRPEKISFVRNGVNLNRFSRAEPKLRREIKGGPLIGLVGRLVPGKGGAVLLRAAPEVLARFPEARIVFVGEGPARAELMHMAETLNIANRVVFVGEQDNMPGVYASLDVVTLPSFEEAMPMCLLEAMAARRVVIATKVGNVPEVVRHDVTGCLIEPGDAAALGEALIRLLDNPSAVRRLADAAHEHISNHYSNVTMASTYLSLYTKALNDRFAEGLAQ